MTRLNTMAQLDLTPTPLTTVLLLALLRAKSSVTSAAFWTSVALAPFKAARLALYGPKLQAKALAAPTMFPELGPVMVSYTVRAGIMLAWANYDTIGLATPARSPVMATSPKWSAL